MAYSDNFPTQRAVFTLDAANAGRLDPRCSFTRASTGSYFGTAKHLSSENLIKHSEGTAVWGGTATVTYNYTNGPDGVTGTALRLESASGTERYRYSTGGQFVSGTAYTVSCWVKSNTGVAQTFRFMCSTTANQSADLTTHATDWTRVTATITPNTTNIFAGFVFLSANTNDISVWGLQVNTGSDELDYQATTTQIHRAYAPTLQTAASGAARFEHSAIDGQSEGILIESQATSLVTYSEDFSSSAWVKARLSATTAAAIAPDGTLTANQLTVDGTASNTHSFYYDYTTGGATAQTVSFYVKAGTLSWLQIRFSNTNSAFSDSWANYNLSTGAIGTISGGVTASASSCGNGWYRIVATQTALTNATGRIVVYTQQADNTRGYDGNSYDYLLIWGGQIEANQSFASSYIKSNSGSTTTRAADSMSVATSGFGFAGGPVSMHVDFKANSVLGATHRIAAIENTRGLLAPYISGGGDVKTFGDTDGTTAIDTSIKTDITANTDYSMALRWDTNDYRGVLNGTLGNADTSCPLPDFEGATLYVGGQAASGVELDGYVKRIAVWGEALSDSNLQAITS